MEDGGFWSADMNSFNHYAYGSVADWVYQKAAGIHTAEDARAVLTPFAPVSGYRAPQTRASRFRPGTVWLNPAGVRKMESGAMRSTSIIFKIIDKIPESRSRAYIFFY